MVGERIERVATFVQPNGLQEKGIAPETFIQSVHEVGVRRVIVAVRYLGFPEYFRAFTEAGWTIRGYGVLGGRPVSPEFAGGMSIPPGIGGRCPASTEFAAQLRRNWNMV